MNIEVKLIGVLRARVERTGSRRWPFRLGEDLVVRARIGLFWGAGDELVFRDGSGRVWLRAESLGWGEWELRVLEGYAWNGCTGVPTPRGAVLASCLHDALYQFEFRGGSLSKREARWVADRLFFVMMRRGGVGRVVARVYWAGVRLLGGLRWGR